MVYDRWDLPLQLHLGTSPPSFVGTTRFLSRPECLRWDSLEMEMSWKTLFPSIVETQTRIELLLVWPRKYVTYLNSSSRIERGQLSESGSRYFPRRSFRLRPTQRERRKLSSSHQQPLSRTTVRVSATELSVLKLQSNLLLSQIIDMNFRVTWIYLHLPQQTNKKIIKIKNIELKTVENEKIMNTFGILYTKCLRSYAIS